MKNVLFIAAFGMSCLQIDAMQYDFDLNTEDSVQILKALEWDLIVGSDSASYSACFPIALDAFCDKRPCVRDAGYDLFHVLLPYYAQEFDAFFDEEGFNDCRYTDELLESSYLEDVFEGLARLKDNQEGFFNPELLLLAAVCSLQSDAMCERYEDVKNIQVSAYRLLLYLVRGKFEKTYPVIVAALKKFGYSQDIKSYKHYLEEALLNSLNKNGYQVSR